MSSRRLGLLLALPVMVGLSITACGTEDDAAPSGPPQGGSSPTAGSGGKAEEAGNGGTAASAGASAEGGMGGYVEPSAGGAGADSAGGTGGESAGGEGPGTAGDGNWAGEGGEGGASGASGPVACHTILSGFDSDPGEAMGKYLTPETGPVQSSTVEWSSSDGVAAAGVGKLSATFGAAGEQAQLGLYFNHASWTCQKKMHAMVKLVSAVDLSHVKGITLNINSANWTRYSSQFTSTTTWTIGTWYAIELPFATANYMDPANTLPDFNDVQAIGVMVQTKSDVTPVATTLYVDDVWIE